MKKYLLILFALFIAAGCSNNDSSDSIDSSESNNTSPSGGSDMIDQNPGAENPPDTTTDFTLRDVSYDYQIEIGNQNTHPLDGFGVQINADYFMDINTDFGVGEADWKVFEQRVKDLKISKFRINVLPDYYEPVNDDNDPNHFNWDGFAFDSDYMKAVCKILDVAQANGVKVNITCYGVRKDSWLGYPSVEPDAWWVTPPTDLEEFAESTAALLLYLIEQKGYTCIYQYTPYNEPDFGFTKGTQLGTDRVDFDLYVDFCVAIHERLQAVGIRDKIDFNLGDDATNPEWLKKVTQNKTLYEIADSFNSHVYKFDSTTNDQTMDTYFSELTNASGEKPFQILEFGSGHASDWPITTQTDLETYGRGLMYARTAIQLLNAGGVGFTHWTLFDYMRDDQRVMNTGMYGFYTDNWAPRPFYHAFSMLTRFCRPGSVVYRGIEKDVWGTLMDSNQKDNGVASTFLQTVDGRWTTLITNDNDYTVKVRISNSALGNATLKRFLYSEATLPSGNEMIAQSGYVTCENGVTYVAIPARSFLALTNMDEQ